ncbi:monocarboxylate transporter 13-like [Amphiura filiformis]|uniref:monocarboxylate transporter 13-like n=1 Tax=Amphiura filiformis TaxID=82378 RepID=UPI003B212790
MDKPHLPIPHQVLDNPTHDVGSGMHTHEKLPQDSCDPPINIVSSDLDSSTDPEFDNDFEEFYGTLEREAMDEYMEKPMDRCFNLSCRTPEPEVPGGLKKCTRCSVAKCVKVLKKPSNFHHASNTNRNNTLADNFTDQQIKRMTSTKESTSSGVSAPSSHDANFHLDTGWAWVILLGCFMNSFLSAGVFSSFGVFLIDWQDQISESVAQLQWIFSLVVGIPMIIAPVASALCKFYTIRQVVMTGAIVSSLAFFAAWFATSISHLYISFAVAGIGFGFIYQPPMIILAYYFDKRLARALGISSAGTAIGNFALPPLFQVFINYYGWNGALLIISGLVANAAMFGALYRVSPLELTNIRFIPILLANCLYGLAYVIILQYLPARAVDGGISEIKAAFLLSILGSVSVVVRFTHGYIIDYKILTARTLTALSFLLAAVACVFFPISDEYAILGILSALVGTASGVFNVTVPIVAKEYVGVKRVSGAVGFMLLATGAGVFVGLYLSGILYDNTGSYNLAFFLAGAVFFISSILLFIDPLLIRLLRGGKSSMPPVTMHLRKKSNSYEQVPQPTDLS